MGNSTNKIKKPESSTVDKPKTSHLNLATPFILSRRGSMYIDEDGDLAHEFYIEVPSSKKGLKSTMKRIFNNLKPQGDIDYQYPRLHVNFPMILYQND